MTAWDDDPRVSGEHIRTVDGQDGSVTLVGAVHDHPASTYRAQHVVSRTDADVLALELPPLAVPLFEQYAAGPREPPAFGGEMSAAIQAFDRERVVGIDGPSRRFLAALAARLTDEPVSLGTLRDVAGGVWAAAKQAIACRLAASLSAWTSVRVEVDSPRVYGTDWADDPVGQARDERVHVRRAQAVSDSLLPPADARIRDAARDAHMAARLASLRREGDVVAVLGRDHLDPVAERLLED